MKKITIYISILLVCMTTWYSCETEEHIYDGPERFSFTQATSGFMLVLPDDANTYTIEVGVTTVSNTDRVIKFKISETSTAVAGEHYLTTNPQMTIPAGEYVGELEIQANFAGFTDNENKTLVLQFVDEVKTLPENEFTINMQRMCPLNLDNLVGTYTVHGERFHRNGNNVHTFDYESTIERVNGSDTQLKVTNVGSYNADLIIDLDITAVNIIPVSFSMQTSGYDAELFNGSGLPFGEVTFRDWGNSKIYTCDEKLELNFGTIGSPGFYSYGGAVFTKK